MLHAANPLQNITAKIGLALVFLCCAQLLQAQTLQPLLVQTPMPRGQKHESRHLIDRLEELWRMALLDGNGKALDGLLADDYMAITASGTLQTKDQALTAIRSGQLHLTTLNFSDRKVRFYGSTALVTSLAEVAGSYSGHDITGNYRYTRVYARNPRGQWQIVSFEVSQVH